MCGIMGVRRFGPTPITLDEISIMLIDNQRRGTHATGVALQQIDGSIQVLKKDEPAWRFVTTDEYRAFMEAHLLEDTLIALGHTRLYTKGSPTVEANNHPMWSGKTAVIHNGVIHNDDQMFTRLKLERFAETDSDIIRAILDSQGFTPKALNTLSDLSGSAAFAAISVDEPGKLLLARSGNPVELAATPDKLYFASERQTLHKGLRPYDKWYGIPMRKLKSDVAAIPMNNDTAYLIGARPRSGAGTWEADWLEWHQGMRISYNFTEPNRDVFNRYHLMRASVYGDQRTTMVICPNKKCRKLLPVVAAQLKDIKKYTCAACHTPLAK